MEFKSPYVGAMRERAPKMFNQLRRSGLIEEHLQEKSEEAHRMFRELTKDAPKLQSGYPDDPTTSLNCRSLACAPALSGGL